MKNIDEAINKIMDDYNAHSEMMTGTTIHFEGMMQTEDKPDPGIMIHTFRVLWYGLCRILEDTIEVAREASKGKND